MKSTKLIRYLFILLLCIYSGDILIAQPEEEILFKESFINAGQDTVADFLTLLDYLSTVSSNLFFQQHCKAIINVIEAQGELSAGEISFLKEMYKTFSDTGVQCNASKLSSYLERKRPFIVSWISPTDGVVSLGWLLPPENWNPDQSYPLYIRLHGLYSPYENPIEYMSRYFRPESIMDMTFEDGYAFFPWGRGNLWYEGIGETDIFEGMTILESMISVNKKRKYLLGHSMGGYGVWFIAQKSAGVWAGLGIYAGALQYGNCKLLNAETAGKLKSIPVYFVCGTQDGLLSTNNIAYELLEDAGNTDIYFTTFPGGHESLLENWQNMYSWLKNYSNDNPTAVTFHDNRNPDQYQLLNNYPNPFNASTTIRYILAQPTRVRLAVYNLLAQEISLLIDGQQSEGEYQVSWNAEGLASGIYFYRIQTDQYTITKKLILQK